MPGRDEKARDQHSPWRLRGPALALSAVLVAGFCAFLLWASRHVAFDDPFATRSVIVAMTPKPPEPPHHDQPPPPPRATPAQSPAVNANPDQAVLAEMLACFNTDPRRRPPDCPAHNEPPPSYFDRNARLSPGHGAYDTPAPLDINQAFTPTEQRTIMMPPCYGVCVRMGKDPPPPSRTAEEICEEGGIGPCHPPDMPVVRQAHTN